MPYFNGPNQRGGHTTTIDLAAKAIKFLNKLPSVSGISPGYIVNNIKRHSSTPTIKIIAEPHSTLVLAIQKGSKQEFRVYSNNHQQIRQALAKWTGDNRYEIRFQNQDKK